MNWFLILNIIVLLIWISNLIVFHVKQGKTFDASLAVAFIIFATYEITKELIM